MKIKLFAGASVFMAGALFMELACVPGDLFPALAGGLLLAVGVAMNENGPQQLEK